MHRTELANEFPQGTKVRWKFGAEDSTGVVIDYYWVGLSDAPASSIFYGRWCLKIVVDNPFPSTTGMTVCLPEWVEKI